LTLQDFTTTSRTTTTFHLSIPTASPTCGSHNSNCAFRLPPTADFTTTWHSQRGSRHHLRCRHPRLLAPTYSFNDNVLLAPCLPTFSTDHVFMSRCSSSPFYQISEHLRGPRHHLRCRHVVTHSTRLQRRWPFAFVTLVDKICTSCCISRHLPPLLHAAPTMMTLCLRYPRRQDLHSQVASPDTHHRSHTRRLQR
jgi:hypothetical protein